MAVMSFHMPRLGGRFWPLLAFRASAAISRELMSLAGASFPASELRNSSAALVAAASRSPCFLARPLRLGDGFHLKTRIPNVLREGCLARLDLTNQLDMVPVKGHHSIRHPITLELVPGIKGPILLLPSLVLLNERSMRAAEHPSLGFWVDSHCRKINADADARGPCIRIAVQHALARNRLIIRWFAPQNPLEAMSPLYQVNTSWVLERNFGGQVLVDLLEHGGVGAQRRLFVMDG